MTNEQEKRVVIITGASSGIGAGAAVLFAKLGWRLVLTGRNEQALEKTVSDCVAAGGDGSKVATVVGDLTSPEVVQKIVDEARAKFGQIDALVNNAGIYRIGEVATTELDVFDEIVDTNLRAVIRLSRAALPDLIKTRGSIVNISSIAGVAAFPGATYYCMSKGALDQFSRCLALEQAVNGVRVNSVNPGVIKTDIFRRAGLDEKGVEELYRSNSKTHPLGRVGDVGDTAQAIAWLADSTKSGFVTGETLRVDGGKAINIDNT